VVGADVHKASVLRQEAVALCWCGVALV
jgi:hypothetical protein